ncbi:MAG: AAA family ATPase [Deltaproteobacteria bacterium]|nr:AAA family ATPase [Deltaproteobacteria bacterium]
MSAPPLALEISRLWSAGWPFLQLETSEEARGLRLIEQVAGLRGATLLRWSATRGLDGRPELDRPEAALEAFLAGEEASLLVLRDLHPYAADPLLVRHLRDRADELTASGRCVVFLGPAFSLPPELSAEVVQVLVPPPDAEELRAMLAELGGTAAAHQDALIAAALGLGENAAHRAFVAAVTQPGEDVVAPVLAEKRRHLRDAFALEVVEPDFGFEDVGGLDTLKRWLAEREQAFTAGAREFGLPLPRGVLLLGVQGCGKSLSAKAVSSHWRLPLLRLDLGAVFGGELPPEAGLRRALRVSEAFGPAVLWIDEIEKGFAGADASMGSVDPTTTRVLATFLTWMQEKEAPVFVVATANEVAGLPPELLRRGRFDEIFFVDLPEDPDRREILAVHLRRRGRDPADFPLESLVDQTRYHSGAELEQVVVSGLYRAFNAGRELEPQDLARAAADLVPLYRTYEERVKALRAWARDRARPAGRQDQVVDILLSGKR